MHAGKYLPGLIVAFAALPAHAQQTAPSPAPAPTPSPTRPPVTILPAIVPERFSIGPPTQTPTPVPTAAPALVPTPNAAAASPTPRAPLREPVRLAPAPQAVATPTPRPVATPSLVPVTTPSPIVTPAQPQVIATPAADEASGGPPWLWALIGAGATAAIGLAGWLLARRRRPEAEAEPLPAALASPMPPVRGPSPRITLPQPSAAEPFDIAVQPVSVEIGEHQVLIGIELLIANTSGTAAEGIRMTAAAISASPRQDSQIAAFLNGSQIAQADTPFDLAAGAGGRVPVQLMLPREALHVVDLGGRPMFVPIVAIDLRWRGGLSIRRFGASFMLGGAGPSRKPGPVWLDRGQPRGPFAASRYRPAS